MGRWHLSHCVNCASHLMTKLDNNCEAKADKYLSKIHSCVLSLNCHCLWSFGCVEYFNLKLFCSFRHIWGCFFTACSEDLVLSAVYAATLMTGATKSYSLSFAQRPPQPIQWVLATGLASEPVHLSLVFGCLAIIWFLAWLYRGILLWQRSHNGLSVKPQL